MITCGSSALETPHRPGLDVRKQDIQRLDSRPRLQMHVPSGDGQVILGKESSPKVGTCQPLLYILGRDVGGLEDGTRDLLGNLLDLIERQDIAHHIGVEIPARQVQRSDGKGRDVLDAREGEFRLSVDEEACGVLADVDAERIFAEAAVGLFLISQSPCA